MDVWGLIEICVCLPMKSRKKGLGSLRAEVTGSNSAPRTSAEKRPLPNSPGLTAPASEAGLLVGSLKPPTVVSLTPRLRAIPRLSLLPKRHYRELSVQKHSEFLTWARSSGWTGPNQLAARPVSRGDVSSNAPDSGAALRGRAQVVLNALNGSCWRCLCVGRTTVHLQCASLDLLCLQRRFVYFMPQNI